MKLVVKTEPDVASGDGVRRSVDCRVDLCKQRSLQLEPSLLRQPDVLRSRWGESALVRGKETGAPSICIGGHTVWYVRDQDSWGVPKGSHEVEVVRRPLGEYQSLCGIAHFVGTRVCAKRVPPGKRIRN